MTRLLLISDFSDNEKKNQLAQHLNFITVCSAVFDSYICGQSDIWRCEWEHFCLFAAVSDDCIGENTASV